jgi:polysaccharide pyruvyl transferase WcaK-like protein
MEINLLYKGCVISGNLGDDILFDIFKELIKIILKKNFNIIENKIIINKIINYENYDFFVVGGGSIIHPLEITYTSFAQQNDKILFINGTGITDCNEIKNKENIDLYNIENLLFKNYFIEINFTNIHNFKKIYGGFRGILEKNIYSTYFNDNIIDYINDIGLLSYILYQDNNINIDSFNRKIILINPIRITGQDCLKETDEDFNSYNKYIDECLFILSKYLIENNYYIYILDYSNNLNEYYYKKIINIIDEGNIKYIDYFKPLNNTTIDILNIIKKSHIMIGTRLHANIISNSLQIPSLNICYAIKNINYAITNNLEKYSLTTYKKDLNLNNLIQKFNNIESDYDQIKNNLNIIINKTYTNYYDNLNKMLNEKFNKDNYKNIEINYDKYSSNAYINFNLS